MWHLLVRESAEKCKEVFGGCHVWARAEAQSWARGRLRGTMWLEHGVLRGGGWRWYPKGRLGAFVRGRWESCRPGWGLGEGTSLGTATAIKQDLLFSVVPLVPWKETASVPPAKGTLRHLGRRSELEKPWEFIQPLSLIIQRMAWKPREGRNCPRSPVRKWQSWALNPGQHSLALTSVCQRFFFSLSFIQWDVSLSLPSICQDPSWGSGFCLGRNIMEATDLALESCWPFSHAEALSLFWPVSLSAPFIICRESWLAPYSNFLLLWLIISTWWPHLRLYPVLFSLERALYQSPIQGKCTQVSFFSHFQTLEYSLLNPSHKASFHLCINSSPLVLNSLPVCFKSWCLLPLIVVSVTDYPTIHKSIQALTG